MDRVEEEVCKVLRENHPEEFERIKLQKQKELDRYGGFLR